MGETPIDRQPTSFQLPQGAPQRGNATAPIGPPDERRFGGEAGSTAIRRTDLGGPPIATAGDLPHHAHTRVWAGKCQVRAPLEQRRPAPQRQGRGRATGVLPLVGRRPPGQKLRQVPGGLVPAQAVRVLLPPPPASTAGAPLDAGTPGRADRAGPRRLSGPSLRRVLDTGSTTESRAAHTQVWAGVGEIWARRPSAQSLTPGGTTARGRGVTRQRHVRS